MPQSITLTASMRSNLASLKSIQKQMDTTQTRLSTGKKVNSAIDNASSYYQARSLTNRAGDLNTLLDSMGQGIQTIQTANTAIESVTAFLEQAKSVASQAMSLDPNAADYATTLKSYQDQYNDIYGQIQGLVRDASYQGVNLLSSGNGFDVVFNETRSSSLHVGGKDVISEMAAASVGYGQAAWVGGPTPHAGTGGAYQQIDSNISLYEQGSSTALPGGAYYIAGDVDPNGTSVQLYQWSNNEYVATADSAFASGSDAYVKLSVVDNTGATKEVFAKVGQIASGGNPRSNLANTVVDSAAGTFDGAATRVQASVQSITNATSYLRDFASELGNNFSIIETRQNFTESMIDVLETGADNLVLADMNEEAANYLALQTRQQLATNALALAAQSTQSVLSLF